MPGPAHRAGMAGGPSSGKSAATLTADDLIGLSRGKNV